MQYANLGRTALKVSRLCLGTMNFGPHADEPDSHRIMDRAHEHGLNFFDTADVYGWKRGEGYTEQIIGRWFAQGGGRREKTVIATKLYGDMGDWPNTGKLSALHIRRACEGSLRRLQTDFIDLYQMHHIWREAPWEELWQAFEQLHREGKILYAGSSNFAAWQLVQANAAARERRFMGIVSEQCRYSLLHRLVEIELLPACENGGVGVIPWSPLGGGLLAGLTRSAAAGAEKPRRVLEHIQKEADQERPRLAAFEKLCSELGEQPTHMALAWLLANKAVTAPIIGPRTIAQLDDALRALEITLSADTLSKLDAIFPGPGKPAPELYSW